MAVFTDSTGSDIINEPRVSFEFDSSEWICVG